jgi:hypothetical protein
MKNIKAIWKPNKNSPEQTVYLHPRVREYFSPLNHAGHGGRIDAAGIIAAYNQFTAKMQRSGIEIGIDILHVDDAAKTRLSHYGYDNQPNLILRGKELPEVSGTTHTRIQDVGGNTISNIWWTTGYNNALTDSQRNLYANTFNDVLYAKLPDMIPELITKVLEDAKKRIEDYIEDCEADLAKLRGEVLGDPGGHYHYLQNEDVF